MLIDISLKKYFYVLAVLFSTFSWGQKKLVDSLEQKRSSYKSELNFVETDTSYIKNLYELSKAYIYQNLDSVENIAKTALELSKKTNFKKGIAGSKLALSLHCIFSGNTDTGIKFAEEVELLAKAINADSLYLKAILAKSQGYYYKKEYANAYKEIRKGIHNADSVGNNYYLLYFNTNLATSFSILKDYEQALKYYNICLEILNKSKNKLQKAQVQSNLGYLFWKTKDYKNSLYHTESAISVFQEYEFASWEAFSKITLGGVAIEKKEYGKAIEYFKNTLDILKGLDDKKRETDAFTGIANAYLKKKELEKAKNYATKALEYASLLKYYDGKVEALTLLYKLSKLEGDAIKSLNYLEEAERISDSIKIEEKKIRLSILEVQSENEKAQNKLRIENDYKLQKQKIITLVAITFLLLSLIIALLIRKNYINQRNSNRKLQEINITKDKIFSIIGHDLKTPLTTLHELLELFKKKAISPKEMMELTPKIQNNVDYSTFTLNNLLYWAQSQMDGVNANPSEIEVDVVINDTISVFDIKAKRKNIQIENNVTQKITGRFDHEHLRIILRNILCNAIKFTPNNGKISISSEQDNSEIKINVSDNGKGYNLSDYDNMLNGKPVISSKGTNDEKGTGLGLSICKELLDKNKSKLQIKLIKPTGSCFTVILPKSNRKD